MRFSPGSSSDETRVPRRSERPKKQAQKKRIKESDKADISFPVGRIRRYLRELYPGHRQSAKTAVFLAAVLDYLVFEVISETVPFTRQAKKKRITPRHIRQCIRSDPDLDQLLHNVIFPEAGVMPHIEPFLFQHELNRPKRKRAHANHAQDEQEVNDEQQEEVENN